MSVIVNIVIAILLYALAIWVVGKLGLGVKVSGFSFVAGIFLVVGPVLHLIFAYGAFGLRRWAWYLGLIASGITVIGVIINIFSGGSFWSSVMGSLLSIIIFIYLLTPNVRRAFGLTNGSDAGDVSSLQVENLDEAPPDQGGA